MVMSNFSPRRVAKAAMVVGSFLAPSVAVSDEITLTSADETVRLQGEYIGFYLNAYVIEIHGMEVRVSAASMTCDGVDCMNFEPIPTAENNG